MKNKNWYNNSIINTTSTNDDHQKCQPPLFETKIPYSP